MGDSMLANVVKRLENLVERQASYRGWYALVGEKNTLWWAGGWNESWPWTWGCWLVWCVFPRWTGTCTEENLHQVDQFSPVKGKFWRLISRFVIKLFSTVVLCCKLMLFVGYTCIWLLGVCFVQCSPPMQMNDLFEDIKDGVKLLYLLEILTGETLVRINFGFYLVVHV